MKKQMKNVEAVTQKGTLKNKKAITLIALVITIVVLIILAGVVINLTLGDNGIFNKAKYAKSEYINASQKEEYELAQIENYITNYRAGGTQTVLFHSDEPITSGDIILNDDINNYNYIGFDIDAGNYCGLMIGWFSKENINRHTDEGHEIQYWCDEGNFMNLRKTGSNKLSIIECKKLAIYNIYGVN